MAKYLFIGGVADGQRLNVPDGMKYFNVPDNITDYDLYRAERLATPAQTYTVFVENTLTLDEAMRQLIDGYHGDTCPPRYDTLEIYESR